MMRRSPAVCASFTSAAGATTVRMFDSLVGFRHSSAACASAARTCRCPVGAVAESAHSETQTRLATRPRISSVSASDVGEEKYHEHCERMATSNFSPVWEAT
jgi:hypothetical protein